jgi:hypothetical protein
MEGGHVKGVDEEVTVEGGTGGHLDDAEVVLLE